MKPAHREAASNLPLFDGIDEDVAARLLEGASVQRLGARRLLFSEGEMPRHLHALLIGTVELFTASPSKDSGIMLMSPGDIFMPAATLFEEPYLNSARTLSRSHILLLEAAVVRREFGRSHDLAVRMSRVLAGHFRMSVRHLIDLKTRSAAQRLGAFLLRLVDEGDHAESAELPIPKRSLASRVGMSAETLSRTLQTLADHGVVVRGTHIVIRDRRAIERFCGPSPYQDPAEARLDVHVL